MEFGKYIAKDTISLRIAELIANEEIDKAQALREKYLEIYGAYFNNSKTFNHKKAMHNTSYFSGNLEIDEDSYDALKLKRVVSVYNSNMPVYNKLDEINKLFDSADALWDAYSDFALYSDDLDYTKLIYEIFNFYRVAENNGIIADIRKMHLQEKRLSKYNEALELLRLYYSDERAYDMSMFLFNNGISKEVFKNAIKVIEKNDKETYNAYLNRQAENEAFAHNKYMNDLNDIYVGETTGYLPSGEEYNAIEFWKRVPYRFDTRLYSNCRKFILENMPEKKDVLLNALTSKKAALPVLDNLVTEKSIFNLTVTVKGYKFTDEDHMYLLDYLNKYNIPVTVYTLNAARRLYVDGKILTDSTTMVK